MYSLRKAKGLAVSLTNSRKIDHVIIKNGYLYDVQIASKWSGEYVEKIEYKRPAKQVSKEKKAVQEL